MTKRKLDAVCVIFARGGSKGLPGKNIKLLNGKPLLGWAIEQAKSVSRIRRVIVSTDCPEIAKVPIKYSAEVPFLRPKNLSEDDSSEWDAWRHALEYFLEDEGQLPEIFVSIPTTSPLRETIDIDRCLDEYQKGAADIIVTVTDAHRNPWFNMVTNSDNDLVELVNKPSDKISGRQYAPIVYDMTTVAYVASSKFVMEKHGIFSGRVGAISIPVERAIDIDTLLDFEFASFLINKKEERKIDQSK